MTEHYQMKTEQTNLQAIGLIFSECDICGITVESNSCIDATEDDGEEHTYYLDGNPVLHFKHGRGFFCWSCWQGVLLEKAKKKIRILRRQKYKLLDELRKNIKY